MSNPDPEVSVRRKYGDPAEVAGWVAIASEGFAPFEAALIERAFAPGARVLDVGCGGGREAIPMLRGGLRVVAVDMIPAMVAAAVSLVRRHGFSLPALAASATSLPFCEELFDGVVMLGQVLAHIPGRDQRLAALRCALGVLRPGGKLVLTTHNRCCHPKFKLYFAVMNRWRRLTRWLGRDSGLGDNDRWSARISQHATTRPVFFHMYDLEEAVTDLRTAGFEILDARSRAEFESNRIDPLLRRRDYLLAFIAKRPPRFTAVTTIRATSLDPSPLASPPSRILLVLVAGIGDFVLSIPTIRAIRLGFPHAHLVLLTTPQAAVLAAPCPYLQEVLTFDLRLYRPEERGLGLRAWSNFRRIVCDLRSRRFGLAVDLYEVATLGGALRLWLFLAGIHARKTAGRSSAGWGFIFDRQSVDRPHEADAMLALAESIGCPSDGYGLGLWIPAAARASAVSRLQEVGLAPDAPYAILNVGSNRPEARLPAEKATEIGRTVRRETGWPVLVTGDERERPTAELLARQIGDGARSVSGHTTLLELAAVLEGASLVVTTDSGPMHMAAATGAPVVALFGPADPTRYAPRGHPDRTRILLGRAAPRDPLRWHVDITATQVAEEIRILLPRQPRIEA